MHARQRGAATRQCPPAAPLPAWPLSVQYINHPEHDLASLINFRTDMNLSAQAYELVKSSIPRIRCRPGDLAAPGVVLAAGAAAPAAPARRAVGPA
jgi:hypothetical protein